MSREKGVEPSQQVPSTPPRVSEKEQQQAHASSMTPPPSTQPPRFRPITQHDDSQNEAIALSSPLKSGRIGVSGSLPTPDCIAQAGIEELRSMAQDLVNALSDARMSAAHFKLQHTLLTMETQEASQRAEVEQQMARREVEVLQAAEQRHRIAASLTPKTLTSPQAQVLALTKTCRDLENERDEVEEQLDATKKSLDFEQGRAELLMEENMLLKRRIKENREHFTKLKDSPMYSSPHPPFTTPRRKSYSRFAEGTPAEPFSALLYADQILSQETVSVPSTPTKSHAGRFRQGHVRGAHSLSSLQTTPAQRPFSKDTFTGSQVPSSAPSSQLAKESQERHRHDRDSTISVSDDDGSQEIGQSQASSLATDMLRKNPASQESIRQSQDAERSSNLLQTKLFGNVSKSGVGKSKFKRVHDSSDDYIKNKKARMRESIGLGVGMESWTQTS